MRLSVLLAFVAFAAPAAAQAAPGHDTSAQLLTAARGQLAARNLDSAAALLRRVAEAPARTVPERVEAWVLLGVVGFYQQGDFAAAQAFRQALALDPGLQATALDRFDPALPQILAAERAALPSRAAPAPPVAAAIRDCLRKCPEGVRAPQFAYFPQIEFRDARQVFGPSGMRGFLSIDAVIGADGTVEPETVHVAGGSARGVESRVREGIAQARFHPGLADGVPVRTRVLLRFDFEAEGLDWVKYSYRVVAR